MITDIDELEKYATSAADVSWPKRKRRYKRKYATPEEAKAARNAKRRARGQRIRATVKWMKVSSERSACADIAAEMGRPDIAAAIRARSEK